MTQHNVALVEQAAAAAATMQGRAESLGQTVAVFDLSSATGMAYSVSSRVVRLDTVRAKQS